MAVKSLAVKTLKKFVMNMDGWKNVLTGLGIKGKDKRESSHVEWSTLEEVDAEDLHDGSDLARTIVGEVIEEAFREGYELKADSIDDALKKLISDEEKRLSVNEKFQQAWRYERQYGGAAIIVIPNDLTKLNTPFVPTAVNEIRSLLVLTRWEVQRDGIVENDIRSPNFGMPASYRICPRDGSGTQNESVHYSRVLRFGGLPLGKVHFMQNNYWGDSILNVCKKPIRDYDGALDSVSLALVDFSVAVMKMKNLTNNIAEDADDLIIKRMTIANLTRSIARTVLLDADSESYEYQQRTLTGVAECVELISSRLVTASHMPHTKILGESPEGSNATGNSTTKDWYDYVASQQKNHVDPKLITLWTWILSAKKSPTKGKVPDGMKAVYVPLWQETKGEQAKTRLANSQADDLDIQNGVLDPAEVAISRYSTGEYNDTITLIAKRVDPKTDPAQKPEPGMDKDGNPLNPTPDPKTGALNPPLPTPKGEPKPKPGKAK